MYPDCTLVTCCFILSKYNEHSRDINESIKNMEVLLEVPCYLIIYCDSYSINQIKEIRNKYNLNNITYYIQKELNELDNFSYVEKIRKNREIYHPTKDSRTCPESHFICCSKFNFVLNAIELDPFHTKKFGWIDSNVSKNFEKICTNYDKNMLLDVLQNCSDQFNLQILNVCDKKFKDYENKREFYQQYRWIVCGCLFVTTKDIGKKILTRLNENFLQTTEQGYGHGEEMFYLEIIDEFNDDIHKSYGDYNTILNNFVKQTKGFEYVYHQIIQKYLQFRYYKECIHCCEKILVAFETFQVVLNYDIYFKTLFAYYISYYYENNNIAKLIVKKIRSLIEINPNVKLIYEQNSHFYDSQFKFCE
jgi:hypothetical protein